MNRWEIPLPRIDMGYNYFDSCPMVTLVFLDYMGLTCNIARPLSKLRDPYEQLTEMYTLALNHLDSQAHLKGYHGPHHTS